MTNLYKLGKLTELRQDYTHTGSRGFLHFKINDKFYRTESYYSCGRLKIMDETTSLLGYLDEFGNILIEKIIAIAKSKKDYKEESFAIFEAALMNAKAVKDQKDATSDIIERAYIDLNTTMNSLIYKDNLENNSSIENRSTISNINDNTNDDIRNEKNGSENIVDSNNSIALAKTSDNFSIYAVIILILTAIIMVIAVKKKKRQINNN